MFTNHSSKEINVKLIYVGPAFSGKAENLQRIYDTIDPDTRGKMITLDAETETTMFFDFAPKGLAAIRGYHLRVHLYSLIGEEAYAASTSLLLKNADGIVFVADAQRERLEENVWSWKLVKSAVTDQGRAWAQLPRAIQLNKHRLPTALTLDELRRALGLGQEPVILADTADGSGVFDTLKAGVREILLGIARNDVKEWEPTPEERVAGDRMTARVQVIHHYDEFFGDEGDREYGPWQPSPEAPPFYVMRYRPTKERPYITYATFGVSTTPQPAGGPEPRIELMAYSPAERDHVVQSLATIGAMIHSASPDDSPFKTFDTVSIAGEGADVHHFALVPPEEAAAFFVFPNQERNVRDVLFTHAVGAPTDADARVTFVKVLPLTPDEADLANTRGTRALLAARARR